MADPFQPKFVDLVRNYSTSVGTGNFVLGPAVNGYSSLATALATGDQFYYSAIGVDKPVEREVGRGTLLAGGTILREPVSGPKTNFTSGTKAIALIAAAEWFTSVQAGSGGGGADATVNHSSTRAALAALTGASRTLPAILSEAGREGLFTFSSANLSAKVAADTQQGLYVAPASDATGASGAWVRQYSGPIDIRWFGYIADYDGAAGTDNRAVIVAMLATLTAIPVHNRFGYPAALEVSFPPGRAYVSGTPGAPIDIKCNVHLIGAGGYTRGNGVLATWLTFPAGAAGFAIQSHNTAGYTVGAVASTTSGAGTKFENIAISFGGDALDGQIAAGQAYNEAAEADGILVRAQAAIINCQVERAARHGVGFLAGSDSNPLLGNCNGSVMRDCKISYSGMHGVLSKGTDANTIRCYDSTFFNNRRWGFKNESFFAVSCIGCQSDDNGQGAASAGTESFSYVAYPTTGSQRYAVADGEEAAAETTTPGTNGNIWLPVYTTDGPALGGELWVSGINTKSGGPYCGASTLVDCYSEGGQGPSQRCNLAFGGLLGSGADRHTQLFDGGAEGGTWRAPHHIEQKTSGFGIARSIMHTLGDNANSSDGRVRAFSTDQLSGHLSGGAMIERIEGQDWGSFGYGGNNIYRWTAANPPVFGLSQAGRATAVPYLFQALNLSIRDIDTNNEGRLIYFGGAAPTTGDHAAGELLLNRSPAAGGPLGWRCTAGGTPGTWEAMAVTVGGSVNITFSKGSGIRWNDANDSIIVSDNPAWYPALTNVMTYKAFSGGWAWVNADGNILSAKLDYAGNLVLGGTVTGSNLSGTNTGDQTITLTGDVTGSGTGSFAATIANDAVTYAKIQNVSATDRLLGRSTGGAGDIEEIVCTVAGRALIDDAAAAAQRTTLGLSAIAASGSGADLTAASVTYAKVQNVAASRLLGNPTGAGAAPSEISLAGGLGFSGTTLTAAGALTPTSVASTGAITSSSGTAGNGYATGAGGTVTQATNKSTGVTLNKVCGQITMNGAALAAAAVVSFTVTNSAVAVTDTINLNLQSGNATAATYRYRIDKVSAGSFVIAIENRSAGSLSEALVFNFAVVKAVTA